LSGNNYGYAFAYSTGSYFDNRVSAGENPEWSSPGLKGAILTSSAYPISLNKCFPATGNSFYSSREMDSGTAQDSEPADTRFRNNREALL